MNIGRRALGTSLAAYKDACEKLVLCRAVAKVGIYARKKEPEISDDGETKSRAHRGEEDGTQISSDVCVSPLL